MRWSLSEFLNLIELRSQCWCFIGLGSTSGFHVPSNPHPEHVAEAASPSDAIYFYAVLDGAATLAGPIGKSELQTGDIIMVLSGGAHAVRAQKDSLTVELDFLTAGEYADSPPSFTVGHGNSVTQILAGRLKVRWPAGQHPRLLPPILKLRSGESILDLRLLVGKASGRGATALLTRVANTLFISALRDHAELETVFNEFSVYDPILRAQEYFRTFPFHAWSIDIIAEKVGLGRSNFATRFAKVVGQTPMEFLSNERMKHAALFLENTDMKISEIAERVGYRSEAGFIRRFHASFGMTPGELRKLSRQTGQIPAQERHVSPSAH